MVAESSNTNTLVLLLIAGGIYYLMQSKQNDSKEEQNKDTQSMTVPIAVALIVIYSLRKEIQESFSTDRMYAALAIVLSNYITSIDGSFLQASGAALAALVILPAVQQNQQA